VWVLNSQDADPRAFYEAPVYCGLDLSAKIDLTAFAMVAFFEGRWHVRMVFWTPEKGIADRSNRDRSPYDVWAKQGFIRTTPGAAIDYSDVIRDIADALDGCDVQAVAYDRWRIDVFKKAASDLGIELPLVEFGQGFKDMSPALDALEEDLLNDRMAHGMHPVLTMCAANAVIERDAADNRKLAKHKSNGRIDGMVALAMARGAASKDIQGMSFDEIIFNPITQ
jgi:phage terminase large subunit-like protein